jgi:hypothetical protein
LANASDEAIDQITARNLAAGWEYSDDQVQEQSGGLPPVRKVFFRPIEGQVNGNSHPKIAGIQHTAKAIGWDDYFRFQGF